MSGSKSKFSQETRDTLSRVIEDELKRKQTYHQENNTVPKSLQTSEWLLPGHDQSQGPAFTILNNNHLALQSSGAFDPHHLEILQTRQNWSWEKQVKYEISQHHKNPLKMRKYIMLINVQAAELRDVRDEQSKKIYELAVCKYMLCPPVANALGQMSKDLASISNYQEALLNRVDARCIQQLDNLPDMEKQLCVQLDCYVNAKNKFEKQYAKEQVQSQNSSGSWLNFFTPSPKRGFSFGQAYDQHGGMGARQYNNYGASSQWSSGMPMGSMGSMGNMGSMNMGGMTGMNSMGMNQQQSSQWNNSMPMGNIRNINYNMNMNNFNANPFNQPEKAPTESHQKAKVTKDALQDFHALLERYITENFTNQMSALQFMMKGYIEYHTKCLEVFSKIYNDITAIDSKSATTSFINMLGVPELLLDIDGKVKTTSNTYQYSQYNDMQEMLRKQQAEMMAKFQNQMHQMQAGNGSGQQCQVQGSLS